MSDQLDGTSSIETIRFIRNQIWSRSSAENDSYFSCVDLSEEDLKREGVAPIIWDLLCRDENLFGASQANRDLLERLSQGEAVYEGLRYTALRDFLSRINECQIPIILFKGSALAYTVYDRPVLRPRIDHDVLVLKKDVPSLTNCLNELGYTELATLPGSEVRNQTIFWKVDPWGGKQLIDVHWELSERSVLRLKMTDLFTMAQPVHTTLRFSSFSKPMSLLVACVHMRTHHPNEKRLLWYVDLVLLLKAMSSEERQTFIELAVEKEVTHLCTEALSELVQFFGIPEGTLHPDFLLRIRQLANEGELKERIQWQNSWQDFKGKEGLGRKFKFLVQQIFPPIHYMKKKFHFQSNWMLPIFYIKRLLGSFRFLQKKTG